MEGEFFFKKNIQMYSSGLAMWGYEISYISYNSGAEGEGFTPRILSSIWIDCRVNSASSSSSTFFFYVGVGMN